MTVTINGTTGIANDGGYTGDGVVFADTTPANTLVTTTGGNVGFGTSSIPSDCKLAVSGTGQVLQDASGAILRFNKTIGTDTGWLSNRSYGWHNGNGLALSTQTADPLLFGTNSTERARIDSSGNLLVGATSTIGSATGVLQVKGAASQNAMQLQIGTNGNNGILWYNASASAIGSIVVNSGSVAYNTTSDYRLKENIAPMTGALEKVSVLKPVTYTWKATGESTQGFIAHELQEVCPDAVSGEKDAVDADGNPVYQGIDTSFLVATLTAAIQELKAIVDAQGAEIAALKGTA